MSNVRNAIWFEIDDTVSSGYKEQQVTWHCWGMDFVEFESGPGNYSTAVIELKDGTIKNVPVAQIKIEKKKDDI